PYERPRRPGRPPRQVRVRPGKIRHQPGGAAGQVPRLLREVRTLMASSDTLAQLFAAGHIIRPGAPLATPGQRLVESRALAILGRPELDAARDRIATLFGADRNAKLADQHALIAQSVAEHVVHGALVAASETPRTPRFVWTIAFAREWLGQLLPGSRIGQDNPDNVYRFASVDPAFGYRISGCFP